MNTKKRVRAQTGGQSSDEAKRRKRMRELGVTDNVTSGGTQPSGIASSGVFDPTAQAVADIFEFDPETLEFPLAGFVRDPQTKKNVDMKTFMKSYPGLVLPSDPAFVKGPVRFQRDPKTGKLTLIPRETKAKGGMVSRQKFAAGGQPYTGGPIPAGFRAVATPGGGGAMQLVPSGGGGGAKKAAAPKPAAPAPARAAAPAGTAKAGSVSNLVGTQAQRINDIQANVGGINSLVGDLRGFQPGGGQDIASLRSFNPLTGAARSTQDELLTGGLQTNVDPLTAAAKTRAGQEFDTATSGINERLASLGLLSSSAQTAAEARERAKMGERIGATGLEAGVQAAEAAAGRRAGAVGTELGASGQRLGAIGSAGELSLGQSGQQLSGLGTALGGATSAAGLELSAAQGRAGAGQGLINSQMPQFGTEMALPPAGSSGSSVLEPAKTSGTKWATGTGSGGVMGGVVGYGAAGGRADLGDFLSKLLYGRTFKRRKAEPVEFSAPSAPGRAPQGGVPMGDPLEGLKTQILREQLKRMQQPTKGGRTLDPASEKWKIANTASGFGPDFDRMRREQAIQFIGAGGQGGGSARFEIDPLSFLRASSEAVPRNVQVPDRRLSRIAQPRQQAAGGGVPQPELPQEMGIQTPGLMDPRRRFYDDGGGVAPGQDTGQDKIPALLRSEELVLTPERADAVIQANPFEPNPELIMSLQDLAKQPLEYSETEGEFVAAQGGRATNLPAITDFLATLFGAPVVEPDPRTPFDFNEAFAVPSGPATPAFELPEPSSASRLPSREDLLRRGAAATLLESRGMPSPAQAGAAIGDDEELGPGSIDYTGPQRLAKSGDAGFGQITPRAGGQGSFSAMETTVPSAQPLTPEQLVQQRLNDATRRRDLISSALSTDPVGSPEKQARLLTALDNADRQVSAITGEVLAREQQRLQREETQVRGTQAQANLNESMASILRSKAQQQTAEAALARQMLEAASSDPVVSQILNGLEKLGGIKDEKTAAMYEAVFGKLLESRGVRLRENGWFKRLFGAPEFEVESMQPEAGSGLANPQDDVGAMLAASRVPITPEQLQFFSQFYGAQ